MPEGIQITLPQELVDLYERRSKEGILATISDQALIGLFQDSASKLISKHPELNSVEHAERLIKELADPGVVELPGGRMRLLVASYVIFSAK